MPPSSLPFPPAPELILLLGPNPLILLFAMPAEKAGVPLF